MTDLERVTELQIKLAFQEEALEALDDVVTRQQGQIERMSEQIAELQGRYENLLERMPSAPPGQEPPPHY